MRDKDMRDKEHGPGQLSPPNGTEPHDFHAVHLPTSESSGINGPVVRITPMPKKMNLKNKLYQRSVVEHIGATDWNVGIHPLWSLNLIQQRHAISPARDASAKI